MNTPTPSVSRYVLYLVKYFRKAAIASGCIRTNKPESLNKKKRRTMVWIADGVKPKEPDQRRQESTRPCWIRGGISYGDTAESSCKIKRPRNEQVIPQPKTAHLSCFLLCIINLFMVSRMPDRHILGRLEFRTQLINIIGICNKVSIESNFLTGVFVDDKPFP